MKVTFLARRRVGTRMLKKHEQRVTVEEADKKDSVRVDQKSVNSSRKEESMKMISASQSHPHTLA